MKLYSVKVQILWVFIFCTLIGLFLSAINQNNEYGMLLPNLGISYCIGYCVWSINHILERNNWFSSDVIRATIAIILGAIVGGLLGSYLFLYLLFDSTAHFVYSELFRTLLLGIFFGLVSLYLVYSQRLMFQRREQLVAEKQKLAEQNEQLAQSRLQNLQAKIEPHFLFNTLANIYSRIDKQPEEAKLMMDKLSSILRYRLKTNENMVDLAQEIQLIEDYLQIQQMRLGERLEYELEQQLEHINCQIPPLLIQPLVENAVTHGIEPSIAGGKIELTVTQSENSVQISVLDNGVGLGNSQRNGNGNGLALKNIKERLKTLYDNNAKLELSEDPNGKTKSTIEIPVE